MFIINLISYKNKKPKNQRVIFNIYIYIKEIFLLHLSSKIHMLVYARIYIDNIKHFEFGLFFFFSSFFFYVLYLFSFKNNTRK